MLRKIAHIIIAMFLVVSTIGVTFSMHYCGGELISTSINLEAKSCCDGTGGCCENKTIHLEIKDNFESPVQVQISKTIELEVLFPVILALQVGQFAEHNGTFQVYNDTSPPPNLSTILSLLQTYRC